MQQAQPLQESYLPPIQTGEVPKIIPKNYMDSLLKTVASRTSTQELRNVGEFEN